MNGERSQRRGEAWPWLGAALLFVVWSSLPLWTATDAAYMRVAGDESLVSPWFYDLIARRLAEGAPLDVLEGFGWPSPDGRFPWFPNIVDAVLAAPVAWMTDWPRQWNLVLAGSVLVETVGAWALARAAGLAPMESALCACLAALSPPGWKERVVARPNAIYLGVPLAALGCTLHAWRRASRGWAALAGGLGALALAIYPPWLLFLAPFLLVLAPRDAFAPEGAPGRRALALALVVGAVAATPAIHTMVQSRVTYASTVGDKFMVCPDAMHAVAWSRMARFLPARDDGSVSAWLPGAGWVLATVGAWRAPRRVGIGLACVALGFAVLAAGPCPGVGEVGGELAAPRWLSAALLRTRVAFTDFGRFAAVAWVAVALLCGFAVQGLRDGLRGVAAVVTLAAVAWAVRPELVGLSRWSPLPAPGYAAWLRDASPGPIAELPFGPHQFVSALAEPARARVNPLLFDAPGPSGNATVDWLRRLGVGDVDAPVPPADERARSGVRWVVHDPAPCARSLRAPLPPEVCDGRVERALHTALGDPSARLAGGAVAWELADGG